MISLVAIRNHISRQLKRNFPNHTIYVEENQDKVKRPAFYVSVRPLVTEGRMKYNRTSANVDVTFLSATHSQEENLVMTDQLQGVFHLVLNVYERKLFIHDVTIREGDGALIYGFSLEYNQGVIVVDQPSYGEDKDLGYGDEKEKMKELYLNKGDEH